MTVRSGGTVGDFMHRYLEVVPPETTILEAAERMREKRLGSLLVELTDAEGRMSGGSGIVTESDLIRMVLAKGMDPSLANGLPQFRDRPSLVTTAIVSHVTNS